MCAAAEEKEGAMKRKQIRVHARREAADVRKVTRCPNCGCGLWRIDEESLRSGDRFTVARCAGCGFEIAV